MADFNERSLRQSWQAAPSDFVAMPLAEIHAQAERFGRTVSRRNQREYIAAALVIAVFAFYAIAFPAPLLRLGSLLTIAGSLFIVWQMGKRTSRDDPDAAFSDVTSHYRARLIKEAEALEAVPRWYIAPLIPGFAVFTAGKIAAAAPVGIGYLALAIGLPVAIALAVWQLNRSAAKELRSRLARLDASGKGEV